MEQLLRTTMNQQPSSDDTRARRAGVRRTVLVVVAVVALVYLGFIVATALST
jgi:hypothetical protein